LCEWCRCCSARAECTTSVPLAAFPSTRPMQSTASVAGCCSISHHDDLPAPISRAAVRITSPFRSAWAPAASASAALGGCCMTTVGRNIGARNGMTATRATVRIRSRHTRWLSSGVTGRSSDRDRPARLGPTAVVRFRRLAMPGTRRGTVTGYPHLTFCITARALAGGFVSGLADCGCLTRPLNFLRRRHSTSSDVAPHAHI